MGPKRAFRTARNPSIEPCYPSSRTAVSGRRGLAGCLHDLGDLFLGKFTPGEQAGAMPPGLSYCPAQKHFGARAVQVGLVGERVCAR